MKDVSNMNPPNPPLKKEGTNGDQLAQVSDVETSVAQLRDVVSKFVDERDWRQFHSPKNLSMSLAIEAAELMEHFQWISMDESRSVADDPVKQSEIADEMADVFCYLLALSNELNIDLSKALMSKMAKNRKKYPSEVFRGKYGEADLQSG